MADTEDSRKMQERLLRFERESRYLRKDSDQRKVVEEVFDRSTLMAIEELIARKDLKELYGVVRAGKEARVYQGVGPKDNPVAVKIYLTSSSDFRKRLGYIAGDRRFGRLPSGSRETIYLWTRKEFRNLQSAKEAGIRVPVPYAFHKNILLMEYVGTPPEPAPTFAEAEVAEPDCEWSFRVIRDLWKKARLVHADFSEFNVFKTPGENILFDMGSAVIVTHPQAEAYLKRDISNMVRFFRKRGLFPEDVDDLVKDVLK